MTLNKYNNLDILRLIFALFVFIGHWNFLTANASDNPFFHLEVIGVDGFFIISGFLIFWSYKRDQNIKRFFIKRFFRVYPLYIIIILLQTIFLALQSGEHILEVLKYFIYNAAYLNFLSPSVGDTFINLKSHAINGSLWTLKVEVMFYLIIPIFYKLYIKYKLKLILLLYVLSVIYTYVTYHLGYEVLSRQLPGKFRFFAAGIILFLYFKQLKKPTIIYLSLLSILSILLFKNNGHFNIIVYPFALSFIILHFSFYFYRINIKFDFSYSIYILHFPVIQIFLLYNLVPQSNVISFTVFSIVILALAFLTERLIEKRFIKIGRKLIKNIS
jgi:peptidoglycan/LPS O-acetylase OafA/YrhL